MSRSVPVYSGSGFDSLTNKYHLADDIARDYLYRGKRSVILHVGDYDPSGVSIYESMVEDVLAFVEEDTRRDPETVVTFERIAMQPELIEKHNLTTYPPKPSDSRSKQWIAEGRQTCQLEALPPDRLADLIEEAIEVNCLDKDKLQETWDAVEPSRRLLTRQLTAAANVADEESS